MRTLFQKLGYKPGFRVALINPPENYRDLLGEWSNEIAICKPDETDLNLIHCFASESADLEDVLPKLRSQISSDGMIWISWPKKSSKVLTSLNEDVIRDTALALRLVDVKVCAVNEIWSGLKLVIPLKYR